MFVLRQHRDLADWAYSSGRTWIACRIGDIPQQLEACCSCRVHDSSAVISDFLNRELELKSFPVRSVFWRKAQQRRTGLTFVSELHEYLLDGRLVPGVTGVLEEAGLVKTCRSNDAAAERGTRIRVASDALDRNDSASARAIVRDMDEWPYLDSYLRWVESARPKFVASEWNGIDETARIAGTLHRVALLDGRLAVIGLETGGPQPWHAFQSAGYARIVAGREGPRLGRYSLYLNADGSPAVLKEHTASHDFVTFDAAVEIWHAKAAARSAILRKRELRTQEVVSAFERKAAEGEPRHVAVLSPIAIWKQHWQTAGRQGTRDSLLPAGAPRSRRPAPMRESSSRSDQDKLGKLIPFDSTTASDVPSNP